MKGTSRRSGSEQRGSTAIEFALTLPILFALFYGILSFGLVFLVRLGLQHSAEDGARAALRYQAVTYSPGSTQQEREQAQLAARIVAAVAAATANASWIRNGSVVPTITAKLCPIVSNAAGTDCSDYTGTSTTCGTDLNSGCQVVVTVTYAYGSAPFVPALPGFSLLVPSTLTGQARVLLDSRALST